MLRYSLLVLLFAHCAVNGLLNDGDAPKSAQPASVIAIDAPPKPVVGLPGTDAKAANATQSPNSTQTNSTLTNATEVAKSPKASDALQIPDIAEMGDAKIKGSADSKSRNETSTAGRHVSDATKSPVDVESPETPQTDIKETTPAAHPDSQDSPTLNKDDKEPVESSKKDETEVPQTGGASPSNGAESSGEQNGTETEASKEQHEETTPSTTSTTQTTDSSSPSSSSMAVETSATTESVSTSSAISNATEATAAAVEVPPEDEGMSSGIVALIMAIVFAIVVVIAYVGILLWRRYLEYRYGTRELLVNDLEFDTNDLRHFEL